LKTVYSFPSLQQVYVSFFLLFFSALDFAFVSRLRRFCLGLKLIKHLGDVGNPPLKTNSKEKV